MKLRLKGEMMDTIPYKFYMECVLRYPRLEEDKNKTTGSVAIRNAWAMIMLENTTYVYPKILIMAIIRKDHCVANHIEKNHEYDYKSGYSDHSILYTHWYDVFSDIWNKSKHKSAYDVMAEEKMKEELVY